MKRSLVFVAGLVAAAPAAAEDGVYRCMAESLVHWSGAHAGSFEKLPPGEYEIALRTIPNETGRLEWAETVTTGERFRLDLQPGDPDQLLATREDNRFSLRIDLDARPMPFAGISPVSLLTGTCFFEPRTTK